MMVKYKRVYSVLKNQIEDGVYKEGDKLPSDQKMQKLFDCSSITVRKAISILVAESYVKRKNGVGTIVLDVDTKEEYNSVVKIPRINTDNIVTVFLDSKPSKEISDNFGDREIIEIKQKGKLSGETVFVSSFWIDRVYFPFPTIPKDVSLADYLDNVYNINFDESKKVEKLTFERNEEVTPSELSMKVNRKVYDDGLLLVKEESFLSLSLVQIEIKQKSSPNQGV